MKLRNLVVLVLFFSACTDEPVPKPPGYFRIDLPAQEYISVPTPCGIRFDVPKYARIAFREQADEACFMNVVFPTMKAKLHLTYRPVAGNIRTLVSDVQGFKSAHQVKANGISSERIVRDSARVFGTMYAVDGDVASPMVFYLTDSTNHFLYGSLYFSATPNGDSLVPVSTRLREDILHLGNTLSWKTYEKGKTKM